LIIKIGFLDKIDSSTVRYIDAFKQLFKRKRNDSEMLAIIKTKTTGINL